MNPQWNDKQDGDRTETPRGAWSRPTFVQLRAGSAEAIPGSVVFDGPLEQVGS